MGDRSDSCCRGEGVLITERVGRENERKKEVGGMKTRTGDCTSETVSQNHWLGEKERVSIPPHFCNSRAQSLKFQRSVPQPRSYQTGLGVLRMGSNTEPYEEAVQFEEPLGHMGKSGSLT